jgi:type I restriction enzyme S subunit
MEFKQYPSYKNSGVEWLGDVPEHWSYSSLKYALRQKKGAIKSGPFGSHLKSSDMVYSDVKVINQKNVIDKDFIGGNNFISFDKYEELKSFTICPKDILITTRGTIGKIAQVTESLPLSILHPCLIRIQVDENKVLFEFINYFFECEKLSLEQLKFVSNAATIDVIYCENLANIYLPIPPIIEQRAITKFLDTETARIDNLISKQQKLIKLLEEQRKSIISYAVTKGLNPNAPMKIVVWNGWAKCLSIGAIHLLNMFLNKKKEPLNQAHLEVI